MAKKSEIKISVELDENKIPEKINWTAPDGGIENESTSLLMLNVWDANTKECLKIDLWTKELPINELQTFYLQTIASMAESYERATSDTETGDFLRKMAAEFSNKIQENSVKN